MGNFCWTKLTTYLRFQGRAAVSAGGLSAGSTGMAAFLTVGTTSFDALVAVLDQNAKEFLAVLHEKGIHRLTLQIGRGAVEPSSLEKCAKRMQFEFEFFRF